VNDFINNVRLNGEGSANLLPPEFYVFGLADKIEPWTPEDCLSNMALVSFSLTWDWAQDFLREVNKQNSEELAALAEEMTPFSQNYLINMTTVLDDSDLKRMGKYSEKTLSEKYLENLEVLKKAEPKKPYDLKAAQFKELTDTVKDFANEQMHSNNWVVHGDHTSTGMPMLASDPHLGTSIPSFWTLNELVWEDKFLIGGAIPGVPLIGIGRSKNTSWGLTAPLADTSDLWQETLDETETKYFVDGEWKNLVIQKEVIKVSGDADFELDVKFTHRGPLMDPKTMQSGSVLFGSEIPDVDFKHQYSHMWGGMAPGDNFIGILESFANGKGVKEVHEQIEAMESGYKGIPMNMVFADNSGDIGYVMLVAVPDRKNKTPYIGNRVLNGETTDNDWDGYLPATALPRTINPDKGYVVTANNRHMPDHSSNDIGATSMSTGRAIRIDEMIRGHISSGHKITVEDMGKIQ